MSAVTTSIARRTADGVMRRLPVLDRRWDYKWGLVAKALVELTRASGRSCQKEIGDIDACDQ